MRSKLLIAPAVLAGPAGCGGSGSANRGLAAQVNIHSKQYPMGAIRAQL